VVAGSETIAALLSGVLYTLAMRPEILDKLVAELNANFESKRQLDMAKLASLPYLNAVLEEGLRIYSPSAFNHARIVPAQGAIICGHIVPPGTAVGVANWAASRAESSWTSPEEFIPERWMSDGLPGDDRRSAQPFLLGPRVCLGKK
jgi:cytochrome P450